jgi:hypothetical protein
MTADQSVDLIHDTLFVSGAKLKPVTKVAAEFSTARDLVDSYEREHGKLEVKLKFTQDWRKEMKDMPTNWQQLTASLGRSFAHCYLFLTSSSFRIFLPLLHILPFTDISPPHCSRPQLFLIIAPNTPTLTNVSVTVTNIATSDDGTYAIDEYAIDEQAVRIQTPRVARSFQF